MFNAPPPLSLDSHQLYLEIPESLQMSEQAHSTPGAYQRAEINQLCFQAFLPWFREEFDSSAQVYPNTAALPSFWEIVNGTTISFDSSGLVLIPTLAMDGDELRVQQEWVDIPGWAADYYIAVQVNSEDGWIKILGYTTHHDLKTKGIYDFTDRTYSLDSEDLIQDLNVLWVNRQLNYTETLQAQITPLASIPQTQAYQLLKRLGNCDLKFPRLAVPFSVWGALIAHGGWREKLYELRQGLPEQWSIPQWLQTGVTNLAQQWGWKKRELVMVPTGMRSVEAVIGLSRQLIIAGNTYELRIFPTSNPENQIWRFELQSATPGNQIPIGFKLRLLTEDLQPFENNQDTAITPVDRLSVEVILEPKEGLVWEIEPRADGWEREVLQF
ncbi:MAG: DUF1822 family protein [Symploca sp. SIO3C6]|nr:DUF1822 family protein [Symploca sp. SIO3C6]